MFPAASSDEASMSSSSLIRRLLRRRSSAPSTLPTSRVEVRPPALWGQAESVWMSFWHWIRDDGRAEPLRLRKLDEARQDFVDAMDGLDSAAANDLCQRASHARSLRELWHLRPELYSVISRQLNQAEADRRLAHVNRHFPVGAQGGAAASTATRQGLDHHV